MAIGTTVAAVGKLQRTTGLPSVSAWSVVGIWTARNFGGAGVYQTIAMLETATNWCQFGFKASSLFVANSPTAETIFGTSPAANRPFYFAVVADGTNITGYWRYPEDVLWQSGVAAQVTFTATAMSFMNDNFVEPTDGVLTDLTVWDGVLSLDEIEQFVSGAQVQPQKIHLQALLPATADLGDVSGNNRPLTASGAFTTESTAYFAVRRKRPLRRPLGMASASPTTATALVAQLAKLETTTTLRLAGFAKLEQSGTSRLAQFAKTEKPATAKFAQTMTPDKISEARIANTMTPDKEVATRFAQLSKLEAFTSARVAQKAMLEAAATARVAQLAKLDKITTARHGQLAVLEAVATARAAHFAVLDKVSTARIAHMLVGDKTVTSRVAQLVKLEATGTSRIAQIATFVTGGATDRIAQLAKLDATGTARDAQFAKLDAPAVARLSQLLKLDATGTAREAQFAKLDATGVARLSQLAKLDAIATARLSQLAKLEAPATARLSQKAMLEAVATSRLSQFVRFQPDAVVRVAQLAKLEAATVAGLAQLARLEAQTTGRMAQFSTLTLTSTQRLAQLARLEASGLFRLAHLLKTEAPGSSRVSQLAKLEIKSLQRFAQTATLDASARARLAQTATLFAAFLGTQATAQLSHTALLEVLHTIYAIRPTRGTRARSTVTSRYSGGVVADFYFSEDNLLPVMQEDLFGPSGTLLDLTGASVQITFVPKNRARPRFSRNAAIVSNGRVQYARQAGDPFHTGTYSYQWRVTYSNGASLDVPNAGGYRTLEVQRKL